VLGKDVPSRTVLDIGVALDRNHLESNPLDATAFVDYLKEVKRAGNQVFSPLHILAQISGKTPQAWTLSRRYPRRVLWFGRGLEGFLERITRVTVTEGMTPAALYGQFRCDVPAAAALEFDEFLAILRDPSSESDYRVLVDRFLQQRGLQERTDLTTQEQNQIISLSVALHRKVLRFFNAERAVVSFRELVRFNVDFSRFYLQQANAEGRFRTS